MNAAMDITPPNERTAPRFGGFVRIDRARCQKCGPKRALRVRGLDHNLPVTVDMEIAERTPWKCECGAKIDLEVEVVT